MSEENNIPAFPYSVTEILRPGIKASKAYPGMTLRDYFAGQALVGILANYNIEELKMSYEDIVPKLAYMYADGMLKERNKK